MKRRNFLWLISKSLILAMTIPRNVLSDLDRQAEYFVNVPIADAKNINGGLETQALLWNRIVIEKNYENFYINARIQPQNYPGILKRDDIAPSSINLKDMPFVQVPILECIEVPVYGEKDAKIMNLQLDTRIPVVGDNGSFYEVILPDARIGRIKKDQVLYHENFFPKANNEAIVATAEECLKIYSKTPYVWGGTTPIGWDCSGFTSRVFSFNGHDIPRDAWQQFARTQGIEYDAENRKPPEDSTYIRNIQEIQRGDLVFFDSIKKPGKITHVGIAVSDNEFIHSAYEREKKSGHLMKTSFYKDSKYENHFRDHFKGARRYLHENMSK